MVDLVRQIAAMSLSERMEPQLLSEVRTQALELLRAVSRHRHEGTDLLYDAYMVDITAAD